MASLINPFFDLKRDLSPSFANYSVSGQIEWPRKESHFEFGQYEIVAFPPSKEFDASLHIDLTASRTSDVEARSILNQVLSIAAWLDDTFAILHDGWSGNPVPVRPDRRTHSHPSSILDYWCNTWGPIEDPTIRRALAIYREANNMYRFGSVPYAVLGFYKILETTFDGLQRKAFLESELERMLRVGEIEDYLLREIGHEVHRSSELLANFLHKDGRQAVAHAEKDPRIDPDDAQQVRHMSVAAQILKPLARTYIASNLHVSTNRWDQTDLG